MFVLVDYQSVTKSNRTLKVYGLYNTDNKALYYYKESELLRLFMSHEKKGEKLEVKGIPDYHAIRERQYNQIEIQKMKGIEFIVNLTLYEERRERAPRYMIPVYAYNNNKKQLIGELFDDIETVYTEPLRIARYTATMEIWYKGVHYKWQDAYSNQTTQGWNVINTLPWKATKNYYYTNRLLTVLGKRDFKKDGWLPYMTNEWFRESVNEFQKYYTVTSFYRTVIPFCEELDLSGFNLSNVTKFRNCFWHNKTLKRMSFGTYNLDNLLDFYWAFTDDFNLEYIDLSHCKGDIQITTKELTAIADIGKAIPVTCFLLNSKQVNFAKVYGNMDNVKFIGQVKDTDELQHKLEWLTASNKLMKGVLPHYIFAIVR